MTEGFSRIDQELCTGCGNCVSTCPADAITGERHKPHTIAEERCVACGRCVQVCSAYDTVFEERATARARRLEIRDLPAGLAEPLFAAHDHCSIAVVKKALADPKRLALVQCGPAVSAALAEDFGLDAGSVSAGRIVAALKKLGFRKAYPFSLPAAMAIMEAAHELVHRKRTGGILPVIMSSCPAAVKFIEQSYPELIHYLTTSKSPHMIAGTLLKSRVAGMMHLDPARVFSVSIGPCTSRKFEAGRPELTLGGSPIVDAVLTTRELAYMIKDAGIDLLNLSEQPYDTEIPAVDGMDNVFCTAGDISEAVLHASHALLRAGTKDSFEVTFKETGTEGVRTASIQLDGFQMKVAAITGLTNAAPFFDAVKAGKNEIEFMELLACPLGCVSGGGQPKVLLPQEKAAAYTRRAGLNSYADVRNRESLAEDAVVLGAYQDCFAKPAGDKSNRALHTQYEARKLSQ